MEAKDRANVRKRPAPRSRLEVPAGYFSLAWRESVHEGGHALASFLLGMAVDHVSLALPPGKPYVRTIARPRDDSPQKSALVDAAGAGAERARGLRATRPSPEDRANFRETLGRGAPMDPYIEAAERLFRFPAVAPLLTAAADFLYHRHGYHGNGSTIPGADLLAALPEDIETAMDLADGVLGAVAGVEATDHYRRSGTGRPPR